MIIRKATLADLEQTAGLFNEYRIFYNQPGDMQRARDFIAQRINRNDAEIFIAEMEHGHLAGFVQLYPLFSSVRTKRLWLLNDLYVTPAFRGRRLSVALIDRAKQLTRDTGAAGLMLETARSNTIGNALYPATGFALDNDHNYYSWDCI
jgi:GNAT superfamily N-acetyltransferase